MYKNNNLLHGNPATEFSSGREAVENGKLGGQARVENLKRKKQMQECLNLLQEMPVSENEKITISIKKADGEIERRKVNVIDFIQGKYPSLNKDDLSNDLYAAVRLLQLLNHPNPNIVIKAFTTYCDYSGQKPKDTIEHTGNIAAAIPTEVDKDKLSKIKKDILRQIREIDK